MIGFLQQQLELYRVVNRLMSTERFDLIVVRLSILPLAFLLLSRSKMPFAIKTLGDVQGFAQARGIKGLVAKILKPINGWLYRQIVPRAVAIDCCTETHFHDHLKDYDLPQERLAVVENATDVLRFFPTDPHVAKASLGLSRFSPVFGFVGGMPADRGGMQMLDVAARLKRDFPNLGVVIVGDDYRGILASRTAELNLVNQVVLPGLVPYELIPSYVNSFDIGFALDRKERLQMTGNSYQKVRQYLACGKAVITCLNVTVPLVTERLVETVAPDNVAEIEQAVRRLLARDFADSSRHAERAIRFVRERLSTQYTLQQRLEFWDRRLCA
jgi:glycosyltransferase involved in cell wall biosynthesis